MSEQKPNALFHLPLDVKQPADIITNKSYSQYLGLAAALGLAGTGFTATGQSGATAAYGQQRLGDLGGTTSLSATRRRGNCICGGK